MVEAKLNLARKWRAQHFDQIAGQDLTLRMLKNSLYLGHYFPVYLFSGQRGCGKTTTARIFASALNCEVLPQFQNDPKANPVPCLSCISCKAMTEGKHPDFIEMDAASHTGVDNVRQIIDAASLLPLMGKKKIYLIDEAHMLSKAAFNALLKILEEPPASVLFILATTDPQKIIETVKSRCFQLLFKAIDAPVLLKHLQTVCKKEGIAYEPGGLELIIRETQGSARDALNLIEQVRFSSSSATKDAVVQTLGHLDGDRLVHILQLIVEQKPKALITFLQEIQFDRFSAEFVWQRFIEMVRALLWLKHGVQPKQFVEHSQVLEALSKRCLLAYLNEILERLYAHEQVFLKTTAQHMFLEVLLLQLCQSKTDQGNGGLSSLPQQQAPQVQDDEQEIVDEDEDDVEEQDEQDEDEQEDEQQEEQEGILMASWKQFVAKVQEKNDPLLTSVFDQGRCVQFSQATGTVDVEFAKNLAFFDSILQEEKTVWLACLQDVFGANAVLNSQFTGKSSPLKKITTATSQTTTLASTERKTTPPRSQHTKQSFRQNSTARTFVSVHTMHEKESSIDVSDAAAWKKTHLLLRYFPGVVKEMRG